MRASRPTFARRAAAAPPGRSLAMACRGGPWPSRKPCPAVRPPGRCEHRPLQRLRYRRSCGLPFGRRPLPPSVGADSISARGAPRRRKPGRYGIGPYRGVRCGRVCGWPRGLPGTVGRAFTPAAPQRFKTVAFAPPQVRRDEGIPPYVRPVGRDCPVACAARLPGGAALDRFFIRAYNNNYKSS